MPPRRPTPVERGVRPLGTLGATCVAIAALHACPAQGQVEGDSGAQGQRSHDPAEHGALQAYRAALEAYSRGDSDAYLGAFARTLRCFERDRSVPRARVSAVREPLLRANRRHPGRHARRDVSFVIALVEPDRVVLLEAGVRVHRGGERFYERAVLVVRVGERWRVTGEGERGSPCYGELMRSDTVTGVDPLASEDGVWAALRRLPDLVPAGRGIVSIRDAPQAGTSCRTRPPPTHVHLERAALSCDAGIERCVLGQRVYRFGRFRGRRVLLAVVDYRGAPPARESPRFERMIEARDRLCVFHDGIARADPRLTSNDAWELLGNFARYRAPRHLCGARARRASRAALRAFSLGGPLVCGELFCMPELTGTVSPFLEARRERGRLRISVIALDWVTGDALSARERARIRRKRCTGARRRSLPRREARKRSPRPPTFLDSPGIAGTGRS